MLWTYLFYMDFIIDVYFFCVVSAVNVHRLIVHTYIHIFHPSSKVNLLLLFLTIRFFTTILKNSEKRQEALNSEGLLAFVVVIKTLVFIENGAELSRRYSRWPGQYCGTIPLNINFVYPFIKMLFVQIFGKPTGLKDLRRCLANPNSIR